MWFLKLRNWYWKRTKSTIALYERAIATDGTKYFMTTDLANDLIAAASEKMAMRNKDLKGWCKENGLSLSEWLAVDSEEAASQLLVTEIALRSSIPGASKTPEEQVFGPLADSIKRLLGVALIIGLLLGGLWLLIAIVKFMWEHS